MADKDNEEVEATIADEAVVIKYKTAGEIANRKSNPIPLPTLSTPLNASLHLQVDWKNDFLKVVDDGRHFPHPPVVDVVVRTVRTLCHGLRVRHITYKRSPALWIVSPGGDSWGTIKFSYETCSS
jgi:hypothetical protein